MTKQKSKEALKEELSSNLEGDLNKVETVKKLQEKLKKEHSEKLAQIRDARKDKLDKLLKYISATALFFIGSFLFFNHIFNYLTISSYKTEGVQVNAILLDNNVNSCIKNLKSDDYQGTIITNNCNTKEKINFGEQATVLVLKRDLKNLNKEGDTIVGILPETLNQNNFLNSDLAAPVFLITVGAFWLHRIMYP